MIPFTAMSFQQITAMENDSRVNQVPDHKAQFFLFFDFGSSSAVSSSSKTGLICSSGSGPAIGDFLFAFSLGNFQSLFTGLTDSFFFHRWHVGAVISFNQLNIIFK
jgi:hypothetical protein